MTKLRVLLLLVFLLSGITCAGAVPKQSLEEADDLSVGDRFILNGDEPLESVELPDT